MNKKIMDYLVNPVTNKLLVELHFKEQATTKELAEVCNDIPQATLYRYLNRLLNDKMIKVVAENEVRGTIEKVYALNVDLAKTTEEIKNSNDGEKLMHIVNTGIINILAEFKEYIAKGNCDLNNDGITFAVSSFYATDEEYLEMMKKMGSIIQDASGNKATPQRKLRSLNLIITPPKDHK